MKNQALFSSKDKSKKLKCRLLQFLFGTLRIKFEMLCLCRSKVNQLQSGEAWHYCLYKVHL